MQHGVTSGGYHMDGGEEVSHKSASSGSTCGTNYSGKPSMTPPVIPRLPLSDLATLQQLNQTPTDLDSSYALMSPSSAPTPRNKRQLLAAARDKLKEVRGEEESLIEALKNVTAARNELLRAVSEGVDAIAERANRIVASAEVLTSSLLSGKAGSGEPPTVPNVSFDAPTESFIRDVMTKRLATLTPQIARLKADTEALANLETTILPPLENSVKEKEEVFTKWNAINSGREKEIEQVRAEISSQLSEIKVIEEWMRHWIFNNNNNNNNFESMNRKAGSPLSPLMMKSLEGMNTLAATLGLTLSASSRPSEEAKQRHELAAACAELENRLIPLRQMAASHGCELAIADAEEQIKCNEQLLKSYMIRINLLEKERRKRPLRSEVGNRLVAAQNQVLHLRAEYAKQHEEMCLLQNIISAATLSYLSPQRSRRGYSEARVEEANNNDEDDSDIINATNDNRSSHNNSHMQAKSPYAAKSVSPVTTAVRQALFKNSEVPLANVDGEYIPSTDTVSATNILGERCRELQMALATFRDVTLPDLRRQHGELRGTAFDATILAPEAWSDEESRHQRHIAAMEHERDELKHQIAETATKVHRLQLQVAAKAAATSTKAKGPAIGIGGRIGGLLGSYWGKDGHKNKDTKLFSVTNSEKQMSAPMFTFPDAQKVPSQKSNAVPPSELIAGYGPSSHIAAKESSSLGPSSPIQIANIQNDIGALASPLSVAQQQINPAPTDVVSLASIAALPVGIDLEAAAAGAEYLDTSSVAVVSNRTVASPMSPVFQSPQQPPIVEPIASTARFTDTDQVAIDIPFPTTTGAPSVLYRIASLPVAVLSRPYLAARETIKKYAAPPPVPRLHQAEEIKHAV